MQKSGRGEPGSADMKGSLFHDFILHYEAGSREGSAVLCGRAADCPVPGLLYTQLIRDNFVKRKQQQRADVITHMMKGFAILELICVNLFLYPWRKEIRTLKKFTGNFVYFVEPVIPEKMVRQILQRVGYTVVKDTEYIIGGTINIEEAKVVAFELYLARLYCEKLLCLIKENKSDLADLLFTELITEIRNEKENSEQCSKHKNQMTNSETTDGTNCLKVESKISKIIYGKDSEKSAAGFDLPAAEDGMKDDSAVGSSCFYSRHLDSDEFLNKYSDLNLAQQPLLLLQNRKNNIIPQELKEDIHEELYEDAKCIKPCILESSNNEADLYEARDIIYNVPENTQLSDTRATVLGHNTPDSKKPLGVNKPPVEMNMPNKQTPSERLVIKLKMGKMPDEMAYPIEETLPPDPKEFPYSSQFCHRDPKWTCLKNKGAMEEVGSLPSSSSGFSVLNASTSKVTEGVMDDLHRLREPPSSMYIPPGVPGRQCQRITDIQPHENHYQAPSLPGDVLQINETLYKVHEDTQDDFVMITKRLQP